MDRCELSDLPVEQCACRIHKPKPKRPDNLRLVQNNVKNLADAIGKETQ